MSTEYGYVCKDHDPELGSELFLANDRGAKALRTLFVMERAGKWNDTPDVLFPDQPEMTPLRVGEYESALPVQWLREHPNCTVALVDEYGNQHALTTHPDLEES